MTRMQRRKNIRLYIRLTLLMHIPPYFFFWASAELRKSIPHGPVP